jgi:hypothetical protein
MTPTEFLIHATEDIDDVIDVLIVERGKDGKIWFNTNGGDYFTAYAMACMTKCFIESELMAKEVKREGGS